MFGWGCIAQKKPLQYLPQLQNIYVLIIYMGGGGVKLTDHQFPNHNFLDTTIMHCLTLCKTKVLLLVSIAIHKILQEQHPT
jgi:hypothetical protein